MQSRTNYVTSNIKSLENCRRMKISDLNDGISNWQYQMLQEEKITMKSEKKWKSSILDFQNFGKRTKSIFLITRFQLFKLQNAPSQHERQFLSGK